MLQLIHNIYIYMEMLNENVDENSAQVLPTPTPWYNNIQLYGKCDAITKYAQIVNTFRLYYIWWIMLHSYFYKNRSEA